MMMLYVSHPYTGNEEANRERAAAITKMLANTYPDTVFINPLDTFRAQGTGGLSHEELLAQCVELMGRCDGVIFCEGWEKSKGCAEEMEAARQMSMPRWIGVQAFAEVWEK